MKTLVMAALGASLLAQSATAGRVGKFDDAKDLLIAQFDLKPDHDDVHAIAALGSVIRHPDFSGVGPDNRLVIIGTVGIQGGTFIEAGSLCDIAFGTSTYRWTHALNDRGNSLWRARRRAADVLNNGGKVWVQEAGQSDFTFHWVRALRDRENVPHHLIRNNVRVVQHSAYNEGKTSGKALTQVRKWANYIQIDDGNREWGTHTDRGPNTPKYKVTWTQPLKDARNATKSPSTHTLWREATDIINQTPNSGFTNTVIRDGGVDFSDCVENFYIFEFGNKGNTFSAFWNNYVFQ